jgi:hypothetical protein
MDADGLRKSLEKKKTRSRIIPTPLTLRPTTEKKTRRKKEDENVE